MRVRASALTLRAVFTVVGLEKEDIARSLTSLRLVDYLLMENSGECSTVPLKSKLPPSQETRLVSFETCLERNETRLVSRECTGSTNTSVLLIFKPVLCLIRPICTVGTILILISDVCVPCVYCKNFFL